MPPEIAAVRDFGFALAFSAGFAIFLYKAVWPFIVEQVRDAQRSRNEEREKFLAALERRDVQLDRIVSSITALTSALQEVGVVKRGRNLN